MSKYDVIVIGGGIAGLSVAAELSSEVSVLVLEQEENTAFHSSGRSAAVYSSSYGSDRTAIYALSKASGDFLKSPPKTFCDNPLLHPRGLLYVTDKEHQETLRNVHAEMSQLNGDLRWVEGDFIREKMPLLKEEYTQGAIYTDNVYDVDVHELMEGYARQFRRRSGTLKINTKVEELAYENDGWVVRCDGASFWAPIVINAAGAWADELAQLAGIDPIGLQPMRRTAILIDPPANVVPDNWPMTVELNETFFIKPDAGKVLISPADETLSAPCDSQPEELDIAYAAHYAEEALGVAVRKVDHSWSGLRNFVADRNFVMGFSDQQSGFFWLAGQGGFGIQAGPAMARAAAAMVLNKDIPEDIAALGFDTNDVSPQRCGG